MTCVIKLVEKVGIHMPHSQDIPPGMYLESWDLDYMGGIGFANWTQDIKKAHKFENQIVALTAYREQSRLMPVRPDGKPNRPLTAYTVEVVSL